MPLSFCVCPTSTSDLSFFSECPLRNFMCQEVPDALGLNSLPCRSTPAAGLHARAGAPLPRLRPSRSGDQRRGLRRRATLPRGPRAGAVEAAGDVQHQGAPRRERVLAARERRGARPGVQRGASGLPAAGGEEKRGGVFGFGACTWRHAFVSVITGGSVFCAIWRCNLLEVRHSL